MHAMRAARIQAPNSLHVVEAPVPEVAPNEVLIQVARAGICGTDIHILAGEYGLAKFPMIPGHEFSGTIVAAGRDTRLRRIGERVTADPNLGCDLCPECQRGRPNQCHDLRAVGVTQDGAFATFVAVPERAVVPIGDLSFLEGALVEPLACVVSGLRSVPVHVGDQALVFGAGPMGCLLVQALRAAGASRVAVVDIAPRRLETAEALGADLAVTPDDARSLKDLAPMGFEIVVEATGVPSVFEGAIEYARPGGTVWVFGVAPDDAMAKVSPYALFRRDLTIVGTFAVNMAVPQAVKLIQAGIVSVEPLVSHVFSVDDVAAAFGVATNDPDRMKVQLSFESPPDAVR